MAKKRKKAKLTPEQRRQRIVQSAHIRSVRSMLRNMAFERVEEIAGKNINFGGQAGEFDDAFLYENLLLLVEYTTAQSSDVTGHLKNKKIIFSNVISDQAGFLSYLGQKFPFFDARVRSSYHQDHFLVKIMYCSLNDYDHAIRSIVHEPAYLDYPDLKYFERISSTIRLSALNEFFDFLSISPSRIGKNGILSVHEATHTFHGSILPESASGFEKGVKVVSFYADAAALLSRAYVLRRDGGWRGSFEAYQRMLIPGKIDTIRKKLRAGGHVFVNNVIATLPSDVHPIDNQNKTIDISSLKTTAPVRITLPLRPNSIGVIDGQHRLYSYFESKDDDPIIAKLRHQQNLLVTGIIYPENADNKAVERFAAQLFLAINSNQTNATSDLRQEIEVVLNPFSQNAIGKQVMQRLARTSPLVGHIGNHFFDKGKLKTTSIVSYGLGPLIKFSGNDSLFSVFEHPNKDDIVNGESPDGLDAYVAFAAARINMFLHAVKKNVPTLRWTANPKTPGRILTVTNINCFLITMRILISKGYALDFDNLVNDLRGVDSFNFSDWHSSQYNRMANRLYESFFASAPSGVALDYV